MADVGVAELPEIAQARGLPRTSQILEVMQPALGEMEPIDAALLGAASRDAQVNLTEMGRRGLDPAAASCLTFLDGKFERGLLAWDLLTESVRPIADADGTSRLQREAATIASILPPAGARCIRQAASEVAQLAVADRVNGSAHETREAADRGELGAIIELFGRGGDARTYADSAPFRARFVELSRRLDGAHLLTAASAYWKIATSLLGDRHATPLMVETFLDGDADPPGDLDPALAVYRGYRFAIARNDSQAAMGAYRAARPLRDAPHAAIVCVDLEALTEPATALEQATALAASWPQWRFAARVVVRVTVQGGHSPVAALDAYLARFGNDHHVWRDIVSRAPPDAGWAADVRSRALREVYALPHDPNAWRALAEVLGEPLASVLERELTERLLLQSTIVR
jgi:hypothetical protein